eukprot:symbB.v1.2.030353.t1/scaffold3411.1/size57358/10
MVRCRERDGHGLEEKVAPPTDVIWWQRCPSALVPGRRGSIKEGTFVVHNRGTQKLRAVLPKLVISPGNRCQLQL